MNRKKFINIAALISLIISLILSFFLSRFYIIDSQEHIAASGNIGSPSVLGLFAIYVFIWMALVLIFLFLALFYALAHRSESFFSTFFKTFLSFLWRSLLYLPLSFAIAYLAAFSLA